MGYHTLSIRPDNTYTQESMERDTILKSVSLTPYVDENEKRTSLKLQIDDQKEITLCSLLVNSCESKVLNMPIKRGSKISFELEGKNDIDILLYELEPEEEVEEEEGAYITRRIEGNQRITIQENFPIRIINASVVKEGISQERTVLFLQKEEGDVPLVTFLAGHNETESIDIDLPQDEEITLGVKGNNAVDILIYYTIYPEECASDEYLSEEEASEENASNDELSGEEKLNSEEEQREQEENKEVQKNNRKRQSESSPEEKEEVPLKKIQMIPGEEKKDDFSSIASEEEEDKVVLVSEGVGKVIGRRSIISCTYSLMKDGQKEEHQEEVLIRKMTKHAVLKSFFSSVIRSREGAVFKGFIHKDTEKYECLLRVGKITKSSENSEDSS
ncbi:hypothetical protein NEFER03_2098 [Nematocida sp. LUAm3]|nr:hypothetical protein NEFER03_2098 [Nematocida sp. LUAm3]KAI5175650.1 hypothetical protein NEFER02_1537 [Nematocida sp. LUAm2]KAI5178556.1 hypothetical protein NEFER01_1692 [Nematocida sp. LUAm1]